MKVKVKDATGYGELVWMKGLEWIEDKIIVGRVYLVFGKPKIYRKKVSFFHPETNEQNSITLGLKPVYPTTEKLKRGYVNNRFFNKIIEIILKKTKRHIEENLSEKIIIKEGLITRREAIQNIHLPISEKMINVAKNLLKFEELIFLQLQILQHNTNRLKAFPQVKKTNY